ncbi:GDP-mannose 4,6-dehydratase [Anaerosinus gibii]|uniref:GDP-mannose 4,6-dehydratase n=1 Tax=Selenobaculum gibii TaxID=3054208 RepID=A0A9Y2AIG1_9FIRM|nr:GDP-mannose 4,6-dehydratase [Selenobaculum gbiensis]WIW70371.1 GDP-mannose 4,6-dehydratase [Selenobaculum gbiensis]
MRKNLIRVIQEVQPDGILDRVMYRYLLELRSILQNADALGTLRLLETSRFLKLEKKTKFYRAATSVLYGLVQEIP